MKNRTAVQRRSEREVVVTRTFDAPARLVFEAWTRPELFRQWWVPKSMGMSLLSCEMDVRVGGKYRLVFEHAGSQMAFFGTYREVTPPSRLAWTNEESDEASVTTVTFEESGGRTLLAVHELYPSKEALDAAGTGAAEAMVETFAQLDELLATQPDKPIGYMQRTRDWYLALGYDNPYRWAHFVEVPFVPLPRPLADCTVALVTTAAPYQPDKGPQGRGAPYNAAAKFFQVFSGDSDRDHDLRNTHVAIDFKNSTREDSGTWFPLPAMRAAAARGRFRLARRFHGMPTNRSQRHTLVVDGAELLARCREDGVEAAILVPNCPVCHQTLGLAARHLEAHGIATVVMGCAKDIVEHCGVPRFVFSDFPLGNAAGRPGDAEAQAFTLELALRALESAVAPRTTVQSPLRWSESSGWKLDYSNPERATAEELQRARREMDEAKSVAAAIRAASRL